MRRQQVFRWGGEDYPQEPIEYFRNGSRIFEQFHPHLAPSYDRALPTPLQSMLVGAVGLKVDHEVIREYGREIVSARTPEVPLLDVIGEILRVMPRWAVFYPRDEEVIDRTAPASASEVLDWLHKRFLYWWLPPESRVGREGRYLWYESEAA